MSTLAQSSTSARHLSSNPRPTMSKVGSYSFMTSDARFNRDSAPFGSSFEAGSPFLLSSSSSTSPTISSSSTSQPNVSSGVSKSRTSSQLDQLRGRNRNRNSNRDGQEDDEKEILFDGKRNQSRSHSTSTSSPHLTQSEDGNQNNSALEPAWDDASVIDSTSVGRRGGSTISDHGSLSINDLAAQDGTTSELYSHLSLQNSQDSIDGLMDQSPGDVIGGDEKDKVISRTSSINNLPYLKDSVFDSRNGWNPNRRQREREEGMGSGLGTKEDGKVVQSLNQVRSSAPPVLPQRSASRRGKERGDLIGNGIDGREMKEQGEEEMEMEMEAKSGRENQDESKSPSLPISTSSSTNDQPQWNQSDSQSSSNESSLLKSGETMPSNEVFTPTSSTYNTSSSSIVSQKEKERKEAFEVEALRRQVERLQMALLKRSDSQKKSEKVSSNHHLDVSTPTQEASISLPPVYNSQQDRRTSLSLPTEKHLALDGGGSIGNGSGSGSRNSTPTRIHVPERSLSSIALDHPNSTPTHLSQEERWIHQEREILKRQQQMLYSQQVMAANGNGNPTLSYNHQFLNGWPNSHHLDHLHSPGSSLPAIDEYRSQTPSLPILISNPQHYQQHQQHESNGENVQRFYSPIQTNQMNHIHQRSPSQLQFQQQQLYNQQGHYPNNQSHGSFSPSSGSYVGSSAFRTGSGSGISSSAISSSATSLWQEEDGNHSIHNLPPSASVAGSRNDHQLEEMQKKIEALERLIRMQAGLPSFSNSPSRIGSPSGSSSGLPPSRSISSITLSLRDQLPGPAPSSPLPLPPPIQSQRAHDRLVTAERIDAGVNHGSNDSQASLQSFHPLINGRSNFGNPTQSRSSGSTSSEDSVHWINHQQQLAQLQHQIDLSNRRGIGTGFGNQSSLIEKNPQDEVAYDMRKRSQSTLSSLQTTFNFNATSPIDDTSNNNHGLGSGLQDPNSNQTQLPLSSSPLQSQFASPNSKSKSKSTKFLPNLGRRKSTSHEESLSSSSKDHSLLSTSPPSQLNRTSSHNGGAAPLASVGEKEIWNGFSRKHSKVVVKTDEPVAKFKQGPGRGRVYINPPEKRKKNKD